MSDMNPVDQARRRLALMLLGTPMVGELHAAVAASSPASASAAASAATAEGEDFTERWVHGFAAYGPPKYGPGFKHFDYVNPDAPKGGTLKLKNPDRKHQFRQVQPVDDSRQLALGHPDLDGRRPVPPVARRAAGHVRSAGRGRQGGADFGGVSFRIRPEARFNNGDPVLAEDVKHSYTMLSSKGASPAYQTAVSGLAGVEVLDARTVRFQFKEKTREQVFIAGLMPVFSRKWGAGKTMDNIVSDLPIVTGPYLIDKIDMPRRIEFKLDPNYWGRALAVRRGHFNFERVVYRMYSDNLIALEAFKAGEFDLIKEYRARTWVRSHAGIKWDDGRIVKAELLTGFGYSMQSYNINMRRPICSGHPRARSAGLHLRLRDQQQDQGLHCV
jgi:microcin C transport system substrate-binding protein